MRPANALPLPVPRLAIPGHGMPHHTPHGMTLIREQEAAQKEAADTEAQLNATTSEASAQRERADGAEAARRADADAAGKREAVLLQDMCVCSFRASMLLLLCLLWLRSSCYHPFPLFSATLLTPTLPEFLKQRQGHARVRSPARSAAGGP